MSHNILLSDDTYRRLLRLSESFDDTAEDVIRRLLDERPEKVTGRAAPGTILPEREYWRPILETLVEMGGSGPANDVIDAVGLRLRDRLLEKDYDQLDIGETRWRNRTRFARLRMKEQGLLRAGSHRGVWEVTPAGRTYLERV
jgi:hypothetical protein